MIHAASQIILEYLISKNKATRASVNQAWPITYNNMPNLPDNMLTLYDTLGRMDGRLMQDGKRITHPGILLRVRNLNGNEGFDKAREIAEFFDSVAGDSVTFDSKTYKIHNISRTSDVIPLGQEAGKSRSLFTVNAVVTISEVI